jgi:transcriptional regulator with XRE-family HTH domain
MEAGRGFVEEVEGGAESLGSRLRALRTEQGITLAQLGRMVGLSASYLSQIERNRAKPSLTTLSSMAETLGVELRSFFEHPTPVWQVVREGHGEEFRDQKTKATYEVLSSGAVSGKFEPCRVTCWPGMRTEEGTHPGEEFVFIVEGHLEIRVGEEVWALNAGDSIHYQGSQPHSWHNRSGEECSLIWAVSPPFLAFRGRTGAARG